MSSRLRDRIAQASLLIVCSYAIGVGPRERGGRAPLQKGENQHNVPTSYLLCVCASDSRFQPIMRDLERRRRMPNFALSRRQHGFESRWGYKIKPV